VVFKLTSAEPCVGKRILLYIWVMKSSSDISKELNDQYFWDVDVSNLDPEASKRLIIERIFTLGNVKDIRAIIAYYGRDEIVEELCKLNYLDPKTLNFVSKLFNKPKKEFRCYISSQLSPQHWSS